MKLFNILSLIALFSFSFVACKDDDKSSVAKPVITLTEVGHDNSGIGHIGDDLHLEAEIVAEGSIKRIDIESASDNELAAFADVKRVMDNFKKNTVIVYLERPSKRGGAPYKYFFAIKLG